MGQAGEGCVLAQKRSSADYRMETELSVRRNTEGGVSL